MPNAGRPRLQREASGSKSLVRADHSTGPVRSPGSSTRLPDLRTTRSALGRLIVLADVVVLLWVAGWIAMGVAVSHEVSNLSQMSDTVVGGGRAVRQTGRALRSLEQIPFVGDAIRSRIEPVLGQIDAAGRQAIESGRDSTASIEALSTQLGLSVALIPSIPILALYVPLRVSRAREVRAVRRAARRHGSDPAFEEYLARRAVQRLPFHKLLEVSANPWRDLEEGRHRALADAELERLGIRRADPPSRRNWWD